MTDDEILPVNRVVTSEFLNSEKDTRIIKKRLFPITRKAVGLLSDARVIETPRMEK
jgi:hypothetical protein